MRAWAATAPPPATALNAAIMAAAAPAVRVRPGIFVKEACACLIRDQVPVAMLPAAPAAARGQPEAEATMAREAMEAGPMEEATKKALAVAV